MREFNKSHPIRDCTTRAAAAIATQSNLLHSYQHSRLHGHDGRLPDYRYQSFHSSQSGLTSSLPQQSMPSTMEQAANARATCPLTESLGSEHGPPYSIPEHLSVPQPVLSQSVSQQSFLAQHPQIDMKQGLGPRPYPTIF